MPIVRQATKTDAQAMCDVINPLIKAGATTAIGEEFTAAGMQTYALGPAKISCVVAELDGTVQGWQSLTRPPAEHARLGPDWGIIASFVAADAKQGGIGTAMFIQTRRAARRAGLVAIDATIKRYNRGGLRFYTKMGFVDYHENAEAISKTFQL